MATKLSSILFAFIDFSARAALKIRSTLIFDVASSPAREVTAVSAPPSATLGAYITFVPPASTSRMTVSSVRPAWLPSSFVA